MVLVNRAVHLEPPGIGGPSADAIDVPFSGTVPPSRPAPCRLEWR
jgi:hypothetical protein